MAKRIKDRWLGARIDAVIDTKITEYLKATEMSMGDLIRGAVEEYMRNHPMKEPKPWPKIKPGE